MNCKPTGRFLNIGIVNVHAQTHSWSGHKVKMKVRKPNKHPKPGGERSTYVESLQQLLKAYNITVPTNSLLCSQTEPRCSLIDPFITQPNEKHHDNTGGSFGACTSADYKVDVYEQESSTNMLRCQQQSHRVPSKQQQMHNLLVKVSRL